MNAHTKIEADAPFKLKANLEKPVEDDDDFIDLIERTFAKGREITERADWLQSRFEAFERKLREAVLRPSPAPTRSTS